MGGRRIPILSEDAARFLHEILVRTEGEATVVRLVKAGTGWALQPGVPEDGDAVFEREGRAVLVMAEEVAGAVGDRVIDLQGPGEQGEGHQLVLTKK